MQILEQLGINLIGNQVVAPIELPADSRHLDTYNANLRYSELSFLATAIGRGRALDGVNMMAIARGVTLDQMRAEPGITTIISGNSPHKIDDAMAAGLIAMAEHGQPVCVTPVTLPGAMTPVTLAACLAQQNAKALFGIALVQPPLPAERRGALEPVSKPSDGRQIKAHGRRAAEFSSLNEHRAGAPAEAALQRRVGLLLEAIRKMFAV